MNPDLTYDPINVRGPEGVPDHLADVHHRVREPDRRQQGQRAQSFLNYIYGAGQVTAPTVDYAPLSKDLLTQAKAQVGKIVVPAA